jgi:hypothetical protein
MARIPAWVQVNRVGRGVRLFGVLLGVGGRGDGGIRGGSV